MTDFAEINKQLSAGGVVLLPTETVYGLACSAENSSAVEKVYAMKGRDFHKTLAVCVKNLDEAQRFGIFTPKALRLAEKYWPGSLTLIVESKENLSIDERCLAQSGGENTIAFRCPDAAWVEHLTTPLALTSANLSGDKDCVSYDGGLETFGDALDGSLAADAPLSGSPSTIVSVLGDEIKTLRQGTLEVSL